MVKEDLKQQFNSWIKNENNQKLLEKFAVEIHKKLRKKHIFYYGQDLKKVKIYSTSTEKGTEEKQAPLKELTEHPIPIKLEIVQDLVVFLMKDEDALRILINGGPNAIPYTKKYCWSRMQDKSRSAEGNQDIYKDVWRLFYRYTRDVLADCDDFFKLTQSKIIYFGMTQEGPQTIFAEEDIDAIIEKISYPSDLPLTFERKKGDERIKKKDHVLKLAHHFWRSASDISGDEGIRINLRNFVKWINKYVPFQRDQVGSLDETIDNDDTDKPKAAIEEPGTYLNVDREKEDYLTQWAANFCNFLEDKERKIFFYYECLGLKHKEISKLMGKKGNLSYQRDLIRKKMKSFLRPLEWVSPDYEYSTERFVDSESKKQNLADFLFFTKKLCKKLGMLPELQEFEYSELLL